MKVLVTGASGYIGRQLAGKLSAAGHDVTGMVRNAAKPLNFTARKSSSSRRMHCKPRRFHRR